MTKRRFNKNQLVTYIKNEHNKVIRIRYYKNTILMYFEDNIIYKYTFKNGACIENKYINDKLVRCAIFENKTKDKIIQEIQNSHATQTRAEIQPNPEDKLLNQILTEIDKYENNQKKFVEAMKAFFEDSENEDDNE